MKMASVAIALLFAVCLVVLVAACGGGGDQTPTATPVATADVQEEGGDAEEVSLDDFVSSANPICSEFATFTLELRDDPARYEDAASALAQLALPSGAAERKRAEALVEAMQEAAGARGEFLSVMQEYREPGMEGEMSLTEEGRLVHIDWETEDITFIDDFPAEVGQRLIRRLEEALRALRQAAADVGLDDCAPPVE